MTEKNRTHFTDRLTVTVNELRRIVSAVDLLAETETWHTSLRGRLSATLEAWENREKYEAAVKWVLTGELNLKVQDWQVDTFIRAMPTEALERLAAQYEAQK